MQQRDNENRLKEIDNILLENINLKSSDEINGLEEEKNILIGKAESVRNDYRKAVKLHFNKLEKLAISYSWKYFLDISNKEINISLFNICNTLANSNEIELGS